MFGRVAAGVHVAEVVLIGHIALQHGDGAAAGELYVGGLVEHAAPVHVGDGLQPHAQVPIVHLIEAAAGSAADGLCGIVWGRGGGPCPLKVDAEVELGIGGGQRVEAEYGGEARQELVALVEQL